MSVRKSWLMAMPVRCSSCGQEVALGDFKAHLDRHGAERIARETMKATRGTEPR